MNNTKNQKIIDIIVNVLVGLIIVIALVAVLFRTSVFGLQFYAVKTGSMDGNFKSENYAPSFKAGDLITVKKLSKAERDNLKVGQIITFKMLEKGVTIINTHRIMEVKVSSDGLVVNYKTAGDFNLIDAYTKAGEELKENISDYFFENNGNTTLGYDDGSVSSRDIIGVYNSKIGGVGKAVNFMQSPSGFLAFVVVPCALIMFYCVYIFFKALDNYKKEKYALIETENQALEDAKRKEELQILLEAEREKIKQELLDDLKLGK